MTFQNRLQWKAGASDSGFGANPGFGKGIEPRHLRLCGRGSIHVSLAGDWAGLAQSLYDLGDVLATTLNRAAILTQHGRYPRFKICPSARFAMNGCGGLGFDFGEWNRVWATRQPHYGSAACSLAITGHDEVASHHILLAAQGDQPAFAAIARRFQGEPTSSGNPAPAEVCSCAGYHERFRCRKREYIEAPQHGALPFSVATLPAILESVLEEQICISTTIVSAPVIQSSLWTPSRLERHETCLSVTASRTQLRLQLDDIAEAWLVPLPAETGGGLAVELYDDADRLLLGLAGGPDHEATWRKIIAQRIVG